MGHQGELPDPGSYRLAEETGSPIVIVRGKDRQVRAFYNTCQHRSVGHYTHEKNPVSCAAANATLGCVSRSDSS